MWLPFSINILSSHKKALAGLQHWKTKVHKEKPPGAGAYIAYLLWSKTDFLNMGQSRPLFVYFRPFLIAIQKLTEKTLDVVLGNRTWGRRMVAADLSTELWRPL